MNSIINFDWQRDYRGNLAWLSSRTILLTVHGSHAYGLATADSDVDIKGVAVPPKEYFTGFLHRFEQAESKNPDLTVFDIRKFFQLAADCNPNIIEILWTDESDLIQCSEVGHQLRHFRGNFLSQKAKYTFSGYAIAQLKRIKTHRKWLLDPPSHKPTREEFGLPETKLISADEMGAIEAVERSEGGGASFSENTMAIYQRERSYHNALMHFQQYENWKKQRNPARAELEAQWGYDSKHAMHLVRLMRMCEEILRTGQVVVKRPDHEELLAIRNGAWSYDQLIEWAEKQDKLMDDLLKQTTLPHSADRRYLDAICRGIVEESISNGK